MDVRFHRTGERRYAVRIVEAGRVALEMDPAPGYDARLPHDLVHFVVEAELGLRLGIFGQLAAGGTAGTFRLGASDAGSDRETARRRRALAKRGAALLTEGGRDSARSERAAEVCLRAWLDRSASDGDGVVTPEQLARIRARFDELSARWGRVKVGEWLAVTWPDRSHADEGRAYEREDGGRIWQGARFDSGSSV